MLLDAWTGGDQRALERLTPIVYEELHRLARRYMQRERPGHSLQTTALVNEAYIRLVDYKRMQWQDRAHFFAVSAQLMRRILVDHARRHNLKRGGGVQHVSLEEAAAVGGGGDTDLVALDDAMNALARIDPRKVQVVEMRFFGGLSVEETAEVLKVSPVTVMREWNTARAWLYRELTGETSGALQRNAPRSMEAGRRSTAVGAGPSARRTRRFVRQAWPATSAGARSPIAARGRPGGRTISGSACHRSGRGVRRPRGEAAEDCRAVGSGAKLGSYDIIGPLAAGGMGEVYEHATPGSSECCDQDFAPSILGRQRTAAPFRAGSALGVRR